MNLSDSLYQWISRISSSEYGPACPYAMKAFIDKKVKLEDDGSKIPDLLPLKDDISVCVVPRLGIKYEELSLICNYYNDIFKDYIFLDTHPDETLTLNGKKTVWEHPAIIIQRKDELIEARFNLNKIGFYNNWDKDFLTDLGISIKD